MSITIPNPKTKQFIQSNISDVLGNLYITKNIDLQENFGRMRLGRRLIINSDSSTLTDLYNPVAFASHNGKIYTLGGASAGSVYKNSTTSINFGFSVDNTSNAPAEIRSDLSDMIIGSNGNLYATGTTKLYECADGVWSATTRNITTNTSHMLASLNDRIYVSNLYNAIQSCSTATSNFGTINAIGDAYSLRLGLDSGSNVITFIKTVGSLLWIGTVNNKGGKGFVYTWNGVSTSYDTQYKLESSGALACVIKDGVPYITDTNGDVLVFNGGTFQYLTGFNRQNKKVRFAGVTNALNTRFIHPNGMAIIDGEINILINNVYGDNGATIENTISSGIWEYTAKNGLVHKYSFGLTKYDETIIDYGQNRLARVGALAEFLTLSSDVGASTNGSFLAGCALYTDATTVKAVISYEDSNDTLQKYGYFVTCKFDSPSITDVWQAVHLKYRRLLNSSDRLYVKFRTYETDPVEATITWTSTTTFTSTGSLSTFAIGDEVEVIQGLGSGKFAHITAISFSNPTYTVTVDETFISATGTSKARFDKWTKMGVENEQLKNHKRFKPTKNQTETWGQFKVGALFTGKGEIESLSVVTATDIPTK